MDREGLLIFLRAHRFAVEASVSAANAPQAAVIGVAITDRLEMVFDTLSASRKAQNLRANPKIALVVGWDEEQTVQYEGVADEPVGEDLARVKRAYFATFPDGLAREHWPGITYFRVQPTWVRYSDYRGSEPVLVVIPVEAEPTTYV